MKIAVLTEVSTREKNKSVIAALENRGHEVFNLGMKGIEGESELTYIQTGFISAVLLGAGCADLVVGGCGTGQGFFNSVMQYPGVCCGLIETPLDAWLFAQINGGRCLSLALNKGFGWAGDVNVKFIFDHFFSVEWGLGYPEHRKTSQQRSSAILKDISRLTHLTMPEIIERMDESVARPALAFPGVMDFIRKFAAPGCAIKAACEKCVATR
jgi:ribose 5-phosphate isomerase RpiB